MFENMTYEYLIKSMLNNVPEGIDKRQGSVIYDAVAPVCAELAKLYVDLDMVIDNCFADTAVREYLIRRGAERGISPYEATKGIFKGEFNRNVDIGTRFNLEQYNYRAVEKIEDYVYKLECETYGSAPNGITGTMTPVEYIEGLTRCELTQMLIPGEDEEDTEDFRERYFKLLENTAFGGNVSDYKEKVKSIDGVGQVRVKRCEQWKGAGTVGIVITDSDNGIPGEPLVENVQELLDPDGGEGTGIAPIGHIVDVQAVEALEVKVSISALLAEGVTLNDVEAEINTAVNNYFNEKNEAWENSGIYLYTSQLNALLMEIEGIINIDEITLNENSTYVYTQDNIVVASDIEVSVSYDE